MRGKKLLLLDLALAAIFFAGSMLYYSLIDDSSIAVPLLAALGIVAVGRAVLAVRMNKTK